MRASTIANTAGPWTQGFAVEHRGTRFVNPTLVFKRGERVRIALENALDEPTIVHWHGLAVDTHNDGAAVPSDAIDGIKNMQVIDAIYRSAGLPLRGAGAS